MNIHNIALVRAFKKDEFETLLKNNGIMKPKSKLVILKPGDTLSDYASGLDTVFRENSKYDSSGIPATFKDYKELTGDNNVFHYEEYVTQSYHKQLSRMLPLKAEYNAELLWAINGLVPDDSEINAFSNNTFSNNDYAIICGLEEVLAQESTKVVSLVPTDTAVKGEIKLDSSFTLVIRKNVYETLSDKAKQILEKIGLKIVLFEGTLKEAIDNELDSSDRFFRETPTLIKEMNGFKDSSTKSDTLATLSKISTEYNIPSIYHFDMALEESSDYNYVENFYLHDFMHYLESRNEINFEYDLLERYTCGYSQQFGKEIIKYGIDKFKEIVENYNLNLIKLRNLGLLPTPEQILEARDNNQTLQIYPLFKQLETPEKPDDDYPFDPK